MRTGSGSWFTPLPSRQFGAAGEWLLLVGKAKDEKDTGSLPTHQ